VKTFVRETWAAAPPGATSVELTPLEDVWIWRAPSAMPRAYLVPSVRVGSDDEGFAALDASPLPDPLPRGGEGGRVLVVDRGEVMLPAQPCAESKVTIEDPSPNHVILKTTACARGAVVLADAWYPGWTVEVDGAPAEALRAWGFVRAVRVNEGPHTIEWRYEPSSFRWGAALSALALLGLLVTAVRSRRR
jgi:hypothetical protein